MLRSKHCAAILKGISGDKEEAFKLFSENVVFLKSKKNNTKYKEQYFKSLHMLINSYIDKNMLDSADAISRLSVMESLKEKSVMYPFFFNFLWGC